MICFPRIAAGPLALTIALLVWVVAGLPAAEEDRPAGAVRATGDIRPAPGSASPSRRKEDDKLGERLREGTRLNDLAGSFQSSSERISFHPNGKGESYRVLENLNLERVARVLDEARGAPEWTVSGAITEFRGANYLLVTKAVVKTGGDLSTAP
ncbi:MAG: hypothetical protein WD872_12345 [Pirellulaceae bacterium]